MTKELTSIRLLEFDLNKPRKNTTKIKNKDYKTRETTQDLGGGENPNINVILDYKTPPLTIEWILLLFSVLITIYNPVYTRTPLELFKMR